MECKELVKEECNVYMIDGKGFKLNLENDFTIQKYEKTNNIKVISMLNNFFNIQDPNFNIINSQIEELVETYHIDYYIYGEGKEVCKDSLAIIYNLKNRNSCVDCILKIFYNKDKLSYMIQFSEGSSGGNFGFSFHRYFNNNNFFEIKELIEKYFSSDETGNNDREVITKCMDNVQRGLNYYYSN